MRQHVAPGRLALGLPGRFYGLVHLRVRGRADQVIVGAGGGVDRRERGFALGDPFTADQHGFKGFRGFGHDGLFLS
ncbi:hypothetical protein D3C71_1975010 [compost metagenome]